MIKKHNLEFLTLWKGYDDSSATWEPVRNFFRRYNSDVVKYCQEHNLPLNTTHCLSPKETQPTAIVNVKSAGWRTANAARTSDSNGNYQCQKCKGWWYQTNDFGVRWMKDKEDNMNELWGWFSQL